MPAENIGQEIKALQTRPDFSHDRAVAASLNMARAGKFGAREKARAGRPTRDTSRRSSR